MKEWMLGVILIVAGFAGTLAQTSDPHKKNLEKVSWFPGLCYTQWFDSDDPNGQGDSETLNTLRADNPGVICQYPYFIEVQTLAGFPAYATGQIFESYDTMTGFVCVNKEQSKFTKCLDYMVRFACPCPWFI